MNVKILLEKQVGDMILRYRMDENKLIEFNLYPAGTELPAEGESDQMLAPLAFLRFEGECGSAFAGGMSTRYAESNYRFQLEKQEVGTNSIVTTLTDPEGVRLVHTVEWTCGVPALRIFTKLVNNSAEDVTLELLESFTLGGIGRELPHKEFNNMRLHRFRSHWSSEALHETGTVSEFMLERVSHVVHSERYGQTGTMPVRGFHPFGAVEDTSRGICWGAQIAWSGSWQMEFSLRNNQGYEEGGIVLGGGLGDYERAHWCKKVAVGEEFSTPYAIVTCVKGDFDELCDRLVQRIESELDYPASEEDLPIIFNEWCTSWGCPTTESMTRLADAVKTLPVKYLVMDAGWYKQGDAAWFNGQGDWLVNKEAFPNGIGEMVKNLRERGLIPGIWFEAEVAGTTSKAYYENEDCFLKRKGKPIAVGTRRFWDHNNPEARESLEKRVINFLRDNQFGYVKIDYNETIGIGCDDPDSPGEGLRRQVEGCHNFFRRMREVNPDLVIENCSSGGHRLEMAMMKLTSMSSFSDAHEAISIPLIAAALHRLIPVRHNQIWAVLRAESDLKRIAYLLTGGMLGRLCLSGDITALNDAQMSLVRKGCDFYLKLVPVLKDGISRFCTPPIVSRTAPEGVQVVTRESRDGKQLIIFAHAFAAPAQKTVVELPTGDWRSVECYQSENTGSAEVRDGKFILTAPAEYSGHVLLLKR